MKKIILILFITLIFIFGCSSQQQLKATPKSNVELIGENDGMKLFRFYDEKYHGVVYIAKSKNSTNVSVTTLSYTFGKR